MRIEFITPRFSAGDPVWAQVPPNGREVAAVVLSLVGLCPQGHVVYNLHCDEFGEGEGCEPFIRPRRDDYQQHEPLGSRADLDKPATPELNEAALEEIVELTRQRNIK